MAKTIRLSGEARREEIIAAARAVFAEKGFDGTTTRELAKAASVSEALIFKHFPNKEAIYTAMLSSCQNSQIGDEVRKLLALQPSTSTLTVMLHFMISKFVLGKNETCSSRLLLRSLCEDGDFARIVLRHVGSTWIVKVNECLHAAHKAGDLWIQPDKLKASGWLSHHLTLMIAFMNFPNKAAVDYKISKDKLAEEAVLFCLRGMGVKEEAIKSHYNPSAFALLCAS